MAGGLLLAYKWLLSIKKASMKANIVWPVWLVLLVALTFSSLCTAQAQEEGTSETPHWFSVDSINAGLGDVPEELGRVTPRDTIRSFLNLTEQEEYEAAAHVLNLAEFSEQEQREQGAELARQMAEVLKRGKWLSVSDLPGRADVMIVDASGQKPRAGEVRRSVELASLSTRGETYAIRLGRYRVGEEDPMADHAHQRDVHSDAL